MTILLMTRTPEDNTRFLRLLPPDVLAGLQVIHAPLLHIRPCARQIDLSDLHGVIFSSRQAVRIASSLSPDRWPAYCVGQRTTDLALAEGWSAQICGLTADALVRTLIETPPEAPLLHLHGTHTRGDIAARLRAAGLECHEQTIYAQDLLELTSDAKAAVASRKHMIVPLFSPRTAAHFATVCPIDADLTLIAMSEAVAEAMPHLQSGARHVTKTPTAQAMADLLRDVATAL